MTRTLLAALLAASLGTFVLALRAKALAAAQERVERECAALDATARDLRELEELKMQREVVAGEKRPTQDVIAQVNGVLRDAGVPTARMKNLEPEADVPLVGRYRTQTLRVSLERLSLTEVGAFLAAWRAARTVWTPRSIELAHAGGAEDVSGEFDVRIVIAATYLGDAAPGAPR